MILNIRTQFPGGPGYLNFNGVTYQMAADWKATADPTFFDVKTNLQGNVDKREKDVIYKIEFTPLGIWGNLANMFPYQPSDIGNLIFSATDLPVVIQTKDGNSLTFAAGAITKMAPLTASSVKEPFGTMEITCLRKNATAAATAGSFLAIAASAYTEPTLDATTISTAIYNTYMQFGGSAAAPSVPFDQIDTEAGVTFDSTVSLTPATNDVQGLINYRIEKVDFSAKFKPTNLMASDLHGKLMLLEGAGTGRGTSLGARGCKLSVVGQKAGDPVITLPLCAATKGGLRFGKDGRVDEITLTALRANVAGVLQPLFILSTAGQ